MFHIRSEGLAITLFISKILFMYMFAVHRCLPASDCEPHAGPTEARTSDLELYLISHSVNVGT